VTKFFYAIGTMSGTSCDGVDVALLKTDGVTIHELIGGVSRQYPMGLRQGIKHLMRHPDWHNMLEIQHDLTMHHIEAIKAVQARYKAPQIDCIGFHGQTIYHAPRVGFTLQIGDPNLITAACGVEVITDFRRLDMAYGGQGAPLVPVFHHAFARYLRRKYELSINCLVNIGGIANATCIYGEPEAEMIAGDIGPGNAMIDDLAEKLFGEAYDNLGQYAAQGEADAKIVAQMLEHEFFKQPFPKALDRNFFQHNIMDGVQDKFDKLATATEITAASIAEQLHRLQADYLQHRPMHCLVIGGGAKNHYLLARIRGTLASYYHDSININTLEGVCDKINNQLLEAYAFGFLAVRCKLRLPITFPNTTGCAKLLSSGAFYPGDFS
jgi:anhydro-N-acetylmuramic acid kinase